MRVHFLLLVLLMPLAGCNVSISTTPPEPLPLAAAGTSAQQTEAFEAARTIVKALDHGQFEQVWVDSSETLKRSTYLIVFTKAMSATRGKLGQPAPRGTPRIGFAKKIDPNLPEGDYSVVEVDTDFGGEIVTEKLVLTRESGEWKLVGYFMRTGQKLHGRAT